MGLVRTALIFGAGYVLGRPEGRAKVAELAKRPEVAQLREQAASTVSSGLRMGKKQMAEATDKVSEQGPAQTNGSGMTTGTRGWRGRRLPSFPGRGARHAAPAGTATTLLGTAAGTATTGGTSTGPVSTDTVSAGATPTGATPTGTTPTGITPTGITPTGTTPTGTTPTGTASTEPEVPPVPPTPPLPPTSPRN
jgi:hypothetical protein